MDQLLIYIRIVVFLVNFGKYVECQFMLHGIHCNTAQKLWDLNGPPLQQRQWKCGCLLPTLKHVLNFSCTKLRGLRHAPKDILSHTVTPKLWSGELCDWVWASVLKGLKLFMLLVHAILNYPSSPQTSIIQFILGLKILLHILITGNFLFAIVY